MPAQRLNESLALHIPHINLAVLGSARYILRPILMSLPRSRRPVRCAIASEGTKPQVLMALIGLRHGTGTGHLPEPDGRIQRGNQDTSPVGCIPHVGDGGRPLSEEGLEAVPHTYVPQPHQA